MNEKKYQNPLTTYLNQTVIEDCALYSTEAFFVSLFTVVKFSVVHLKRQTFYLQQWWKISPTATLLLKKHEKPIN